MSCWCFLFCIAHSLSLKQCSKQNFGIYQYFMAKRIANSELIENQSQFIITIKLNIYFNYNRLTLCILKHFNGRYV